ncbi:ACT domain-containing protein [Roseiarcus sp.]|uniref:ACT domain-containing protein n=1 Tax=Roseiarcus sp. TaxID=1969460 RepID=UPI003F9731CD
MSKSEAPEPVREAHAMVAGMRPVLDAGEVVFCTTADGALARKAQAHALGSFREAEGVSLILPSAAAEALGFPVDLPMRRIELSVNSALDGVGLTAAVASALAGERIPCNIVAAFHHDHVFVPAGLAERALTILEALQADAARNGLPFRPRGAGA